MKKKQIPNHYAVIKNHGIDNYIEQSLNEFLEKKQK